MVLDLTGPAIFFLKDHRLNVLVFLAIYYLPQLFNSESLKVVIANM